ncbi:MAG: hypothetical protein HKN68_22985 [Saprospiraceae bacterium]|nr:hypothetical protein [Saprospiraceae bacterium]
MHNQRRKFINKGLKSLMKMVIENEIPEELNPNEEKIKMMTPDGKLVEVSPNHINKKKKVSNKEILEWIDKKNTHNSNK